PDQERYFSGLVAKQLGIPIHYIVRDDEPFGWEPSAAPIHTPEPTEDPLGIVASQQSNREIASRARVFFSGYGPDAVLSYEWRPHLAWLIRGRRWARLCRDAIHDFAAYPRLPLLPRLPRIWKERRNPDWYSPTLPSWLNKDFQRRIRLRERWEEINK